VEYNRERQEEYKRYEREKDRTAVEETEREQQALTSE